jgi:methionyl-tRNA synthetase
LETVRYYILSQIPTSDDGDFSNDRFKEVYNSDLANGLGNLVARVAKLAETSGEDFAETTSKFYPQVVEKLETIKLEEGLAHIWAKIRELDQLIEKEQPWKKSGPDLKSVLDLLIPEIRQIAFNLQPFLPDTAQKIINQFKGPKIVSSTPLFPRLK